MVAEIAKGFTAHGLRLPLAPRSPSPMRCRVRTRQPLPSLVADRSSPAPPPDRSARSAASPSPAATSAPGPPRNAAARPRTSPAAAAGGETQLSDLKRAMFDLAPRRFCTSATPGPSLIRARFTPGGCLGIPDAIRRNRFEGSAFSTLRPRCRSPNKHRGAVGEGWETQLSDLKRAMFDHGAPPVLHLGDLRPEFDWGDVHSGRLPMVTRLPPPRRAPQAASRGAGGATRQGRRGGYPPFAHRDLIVRGSSPWTKRG